MTGRWRQGVTNDHGAKRCTRAPQPAVAARIPARSWATRRFYLSFDIDVLDPGLFAPGNRNAGDRRACEAGQAQANPAAPGRAALRGHGRGSRVAPAYDVAEINRARRRHHGVGISLFVGYRFVDRDS